ncbi:MAG: thioredoxin domain-containing protein, partial [Planctomycetes bacterium]|nr:thioredoxin domain-containing protein [Planctomycetota bacterium]
MNATPRPAGPGPRENRLSAERSPYLLLHARNPVDWRPWGPEAFEEARALDKPVFLSVGYASCHWCHVMARESFEDAETAAALNQAFVCVKVDREERPDVDAAYMEVCQRMTGSGGWPLSVFLTPDRKPFFAATYIPRESRGGRIGLRDLASRVRGLWASSRDLLAQDADAAARELAARGDQAGAEPGREALDACFRQLSELYDPARGGFGGRPKFPTPQNAVFLLRYAEWTGETEAREMAVATLRAMALGGVWDHLGFGFHRYSTDAEWRLPHFEKMLYDQALLASAYLEGFRATGDAGLAGAARRTLEYALRDLALPEGGFASAEDAESEGEEGKFYVWTRREILDALGTAEGESFCAAFGVEEEGNFGDEATGRLTGANVLFLPKPLAAFAAERGAEPEALERELESARARLLEVRGRRARPRRDGKALADWNGLAISALAGAAFALDEPAFLAAARRAAGFVLGRMRTPEGRLLHRWFGGEAGVTGFADDHAFLVRGLLDLYEADFDPDWLAEAVRIQAAFEARFLDAAGGGYFSTPDDGEIVLARRKEAWDGALPSANSVAAMNLLRLARLTGDPSYEERAAGTLRAFSAAVEASPAGFAELLLAAGARANPPAEIVVCGEARAPDTRAMLDVLRRAHLPGAARLLKEPGPRGEVLTQVAPWTRDYAARGGRATAYVCRGGTCKLPVSDP